MKYIPKTDRSYWSLTDTMILADLWNFGFSARQIMHRFDGRSRNALLGKLRRIRKDETLAGYLSRPVDRTKSHKGGKRRA